MGREEESLELANMGKDEVAAELQSLRERVAKEDERRAQEVNDFEDRLNKVRADEIWCRVYRRLLHLRINHMTMYCTPTTHEKWWQPGGWMFIWGSPDPSRLSHRTI